LKEYVRVAVVLPVGPNSRDGFVLGVIDSIARYVTPNRRIILADYSEQGAGERLQAKLPQVEVVRAPTKAKGAKFAAIARGLAYATENYRFGTALVLDSSTVVLRPRPEEEAIRLFHAHPGIGIAGPLPPAGRATEMAREQESALRAPVDHLPARLRHPRGIATLARLLTQAEANGYDPAANLYGGAFFLSEAFVCCLNEAGLLNDARLHALTVPDAQLTGLLVKAVGMDHGVLNNAPPVFACAWYGLPPAPAPSAAVPAPAPTADPLGRSKRSGRLPEILRGAPDALLPDVPKPAPGGAR
jgi:hypothetical protein